MHTANPCFHLASRHRIASTIGPSLSNYLQHRPSPQLFGLMALVIQQLRSSATETVSATHPKEEYVLDGDRHPRQVADVYLPRGAGPYPSVILVHGSTGIFGEIKSQAVAYITTRLVNVGYAVVRVDYRPVLGRGNIESATKDVEQAIDWWVGRIGDYVLDAQRIALIGLGVGANVGMLAARRHKRTLCHLISVYGFFDWTTPRGLLARVFRYLAISSNNTDDVSPLKHAEDLPMPVTLLHGAKDRLSPIEYAREYQRIRETKKLPIELQVYGNLGHGFLEQTSHPQCLSAIEAILAALEGHRSSLDW